MTTDQAVFELRDTAGLGVSFRSQLYLLAASRRWLFAVLGLLAVLGMVWLFAGQVQWSALMIASIFATPLAAAWSLVAWQGEHPARRTYHWSLPVPRAAHDLMRVAVGAIYLLGAYLVFALVGALLGAQKGDAALSAIGWASVLTAPLIVYLFTMPLVLWSGYRITRWLLGVAFVYPPLAMIFERLGNNLLIDILEYWMNDSKLSLVNALFEGTVSEMFRANTVSVGQWAGATALWLAIGVALTVLAAAFRPDDVRRLARRARGSD